jgi:hypothetical protein
MDDDSDSESGSYQQHPDIWMYDPPTPISTEKVKACYYTIFGNWDHEILGQFLQACNEFREIALVVFAEAMLALLDHVQRTTPTSADGSADDLDGCCSLGACLDKVEVASALAAQSLGNVDSYLAILKENVRESSKRLLESTLQAVAEKTLTEQNSREKIIAKHVSRQKLLDTSFQTLGEQIVSMHASLEKFRTEAAHVKLNAPDLPKALWRVQKQTWEHARRYYSNFKFE